jgi:hypothetical protein
VLDYFLRFIAGGVAVSMFAALGDTLQPKSFAGLFGAAWQHSLSPCRKKAHPSQLWKVAR